MMETTFLLLKLSFVKLPSTMAVPAAHQTTCPRLPFTIFRIAFRPSKMISMTLFSTLAISAFLQSGFTVVGESMESMVSAEQVKMCIMDGIDREIQRRLKPEVYGWFWERKPWTDDRLQNQMSFLESWAKRTEDRTGTVL